MYNPNFVCMSDGVPETCHLNQFMQRIPGYIFLLREEYKMILP
jgi:hypothetical protein